VVRVNDRGPYIKSRIIDLSQAAARALGIDGLGRVVIQRLESESKERKRYRRAD
jgi:rare lipoprotein A